MITQAKRFAACRFYPSGGRVGGGVFLDIFPWFVYDESMFFSFFNPSRDTFLGIVLGIFLVALVRAALGF